LILSYQGDQRKHHSEPMRQELSIDLEPHIPVLAICLKLEAEIARLEPAERELFLEEMEIKEPGIERVARAIYKHLGLISFLTVGADEVRAWTINEGTKAREAAGKVHTDIERGFIRAEVVKYDDMEELGDMVKIKEKGLARLEGKDYIVQDEETAEFLEELLTNTRVPLVLDADALNIMAYKKHLLTLSSLAEQRKHWVLTPHPGEMARLCGTSISEIQENRLQYAEQASQEWGVTVVLKGNKTIVAAPGSPLFINPTGNPGLASGGTGDVLAGLIASFLAQGLLPVQAAYCGAYIHGLAADQIADKKGTNGMIAGDLLDEIPLVIEGLSAVDERGRKG
jgi:hydroxyethylthiazole kinase-like sugar kinase family protein